MHCCKNMKNFFNIHEEKEQDISHLNMTNKERQFDERHKEKFYYLDYN